MASFLDLAGLTYFKQRLFSKLALKDEVVLLTPQTLTAEQQTQARANIGAGSAADVTSQGTRLTAVEKKASDNATDITNLQGAIPTKTSQLTNDSGYVKATSGTTDLTAGTSPLATGELYFVYE